MSSKADIAALASSSPTGLVSIEDARRALGNVAPLVATKRLAALTRLGWLTRARRGLYAIVPLGASADSVTPEDNWVLAARLFSPCYIGGWSAAEHWELTEQLFRSTFVATAAAIRRTHATVLGAEFHLARVPSARLTGITTVWRSTERVPVSSPERTIVDAARDPSWVGGIRHLAEILTAYSRLPRADAATLGETLRDFGNGAAAKRLGFLLERNWPDAAAAIRAAYHMKTAGVLKLDPAVSAKGQLLKRWGLWVNSSVA